MTLGELHMQIWQREESGAHTPDLVLSLEQTNKQTTNKCGFSTTSNPITLLLLAAHRGVRQCTLVCPLPVILSPQCDAIVSTRAVPPFPPVSQSGPSELRGGREGRGPLSTPIFRL